ncbi:MAG TPA: CYTH domain-containing protein, partial [Candidatus Limnocylindrales bacterium]|nr:CYTH domain-containing protein [Candidatus Limnocylindrales bacterium]
MTLTEGRPIEVELKFRVVDLAAAERYLVAETVGAFSGGPGARATQLEDRYVDTAGGALTKAGFAVRLRQSGRETIVSVKSLARTNGAGGSIRREELEGPADRTAGPLEWPASDARSLVLELAGDAPLVELVTIRQLRRKRIVRDGETRVELSLDEVDVVARSRVVDRFVELEAELVKGDEARLVGLAEVFAADPALAPEHGSKLEA